MALQHLQQSQHTATSAAETSSELPAAAVAAVAPTPTAPATAALLSALGVLGAEGVLAALRDVQATAQPGAGLAGPAFFGAQTAGNLAVGALFSDSALDADDAAMAREVGAEQYAAALVDARVRVYSRTSRADAHAGLLCAEECYKDVDTRYRDLEYQLKSCGLMQTHGPSWTSRRTQPACTAS